MTRKTTHIIVLKAYKPLKTHHKTRKGESDRPLNNPKKKKRPVPTPAIRAISSFYSFSLVIFRKESKRKVRVNDQQLRAPSFFPMISLFSGSPHNLTFNHTVILQHGWSNYMLSLWCEPSPLPLATVSNEKAGSNSNRENGRAKFIATNILSETRPTLISAI